MTIYDGVKTLKGSGVEIPDCGRNDLPEFFKQMGYRVGVEVGTAKGLYAEVIGKAGLKLYCVDPWAPAPDYNRPSFTERLSAEYEEAKTRLAPYDCTLVRKLSMDAVKDFEDESIDFVYIDGHHGFKYVTEDIFEWSKKVKKGGTISGHDYIVTKSATNSPYVCQVPFVIDAYTKAFKIKDWYLLGRKHAPEGETRDPQRSWLWIRE